jgi:hypothetical protein
MCAARGERPKGEANMSPGAGWVKWTDPVEGAFTIDVPAGWQATGGTFRPTPADQRYVVQARAADGSAQIFIGDEKIPNFVEPQSFFMMAPPEGSWYAPGMMVMNFRTGEQYAKEYGQNFFRWLSGQPATLAFSNPDPNTETQFPRQGLLPGASVSAGLAQFSIFSPQRPGVGVVSAVVIRNPMPGSTGAMWNVALINRVAVVDGAMTMPTVELMRHMLASFAFVAKAAASSLASAPSAPANPAHAANADPAQVWRELQQAQTQAIQDMTKNAQAAYDQSNKAWDDVIKS